MRQEIWQRQQGLARDEAQVSELGKAETIIGVGLTTWIAIICLAFWAAPSRATSDEILLTNPKATEILQSCLEALGGVERLEDLQSLEAIGKIAVFGLEGDYRTVRRADGSVLLDVDLEVVHIERGFDGATAWQRRDGKLSLVAGNTKRRLLRGGQLRSLLVHQQQKTPVVLVGQESIDDHQTWILEFRPGSGPRERFAIDTTTHLPLREEHLLPPLPDADSGSNDHPTLLLSDYRLVDGLQLPHQVIQQGVGRRQVVTLDEYRVDKEAPDGWFHPPTIEADQAKPYEASLSQLPHRVFKEHDGVWEVGERETWVFHVLVNEAHDRLLKPVFATIQLFAGTELVRSEELRQAGLEDLLAVRFQGNAGQEELFDLRHQFTAPRAQQIDRMQYTLRLETPSGQPLEKSLEISLERYAQKARLNFPLRGPFLVVAGHDANEAHKGEWSQHYADDILAVGPQYELLKKGTDGSHNEDFVTWDAEIRAPAAGKVIYARNDIADNPRPGVIDTATLRQAPDPIYAIGGNCIVIDHGNSEYSFLAHFRHGSVQVKTGDRVESGQLLGRLGNSGNSDAPHLHYHLMAGPDLMRSDGLPPRFDNVYLEILEDEEGAPMPSPRRGIPLVARSPE